MRTVLWVLTLLLILGIGRPTAAQGPTPTRSYTQFTADGRHLLVMLVPKATPRYNPEKDAVRQQHADSGLYVPDKNDQPLWTVDWYAYPVWPANDAVHLVRSGGPNVAKSMPRPDGPIAKGDDSLLASDAFSFYKSGQFVRAVKISELVLAPAECPVSETGIQWLKTAELDDATMTFVVVTGDGTRTTLDVRTGNVTGQERPTKKDGSFGVEEIVPIAIGVVLVGGLAIWYFRRRSQPRPPAPRNDEPGPNFSSPG